MLNIKPHPRLWLTPENKAQLLRKQGCAAVADWIQFARDLANRTLQGGQAFVSAKVEESELRTPYAHLEAQAFVFQLDCNPANAVAALRMVRSIMEFDARSDLGLAEQIHQVALAYDWCWAAWSAEERKPISRWLIEAATRLQPENSHCKGNPDNPFNNWFGVCHSAAGIASLAVAGEEEGAEGIAHLSMERVASYALNFSDQGLSYEGIGYGCYALSNVGSMILAARSALDLDIAANAEGLGKALRAVAITAVNRKCAIEEVGDKPENRPSGSRICWNDDGTNVMSGRALAMLYGLSDERWGAPIAKYWEPVRKQCALSLSGNQTGFAWLSIYYPAGVDEVKAPGDELPRSIIDKRLGMAFFRNRYQDADDCVFGVYAKAYHPGGHEHEDAGSFRLFGLDGGWSQCGGQNKLAPIYQSVLLKNGKQIQDATRGVTKTGQLSYYSADAQGSGVVNMRLARLYESKIVDRSFAIDFSGAAGVPAVLGMVDHLWDSEPQDWSWTLCFEPGTEYAPLPEENGFVLTQPRNGATCAFRFITPEKLKFELHQGPPTQRTFAGGNTQHYIGSSYICATVRAEETRFFAVVTMQYGDPVPMEVTGSGIDAVVTIGQARIRYQRGKWYHGPVRIENLS